MQLDNVLKLNIKRSKRVKKEDKPRGPWPTAGNPTKQEMRKSVGSAEEKAIYPKMIAVLREKKSAESVVLLDTSLKYAELKIHIKIESSS